MQELETIRKESVVVTGFAEAAPTRAKQGKDSHMILFSKTARKKFDVIPIIHLTDIRNVV